MAKPLPPGPDVVRCPFCAPCWFPHCIRAPLAPGLCGDGWCRDCCPECEGTGLVAADAPIAVRPVVRVRRVPVVPVELGDAE